MNLITENNTSGIVELEERLADFYANTDSYDAFQRQSWHPHMWMLIVNLLPEPSEKRLFRVLEIGAGRSGLDRFLKENTTPETRKTIHLCCQDITKQNIAYLEENADEVVIDDIHSIGGEWDVITHSYVFEHIVRPQAFLSTIYNLLSLGGRHIFQCPRYDLPIYAPPSMDHLGVLEKCRINLKRCLSSEKFLIIDDPSIFHLPFYRDRDAIHLTSKAGIIRHHRGFGEIDSFEVTSAGFKDFILKKILTLKVIIKKTENKRMKTAAYCLASI
jgi:hypothetical protein